LWFFAAGKQSISKEQFFVGFVFLFFLLFSGFVLLFFGARAVFGSVSVSLERETCLQLSKSPAMNQIPGAAEEHRRSTDLPIVL